MPKRAVVQYKHKCMEILCKSIHRTDKWLAKLKNKHICKFKPYLNDKYKIVLFKTDVCIQEHN